MIKKILTLCFALFTAIAMQSQEQSEGIKFFKGTFEEGVAQAKKENKVLFVDFYAEWCGPCKRMAKNVFTQKVVGDYFNDKFISMQIDAEKPENRAISKKFKVDAFPTLGFFNSDGTPISINVGGLDASGLIKLGQIAVGEVISFEELYKKHKKDPDNLDIQQDLLRRAPNFLSAQEGLNAEKWLVRLKKLYNSYIDKKMGPDLINKEDYIIISLLSGNDDEEKLKIVNFINSNLEEWKKAVGNAPAYYIIEYNDKVIEDLSKKGDENYKKHLEKIRGEYKNAYSVVPNDGVEPYEKARIYYEGLFSLYKDKNAKKYAAFIDDYLKLLGDEASSNDYAKAAQDLYYAAGDILDNDMHKVAIGWLEQALAFKSIPILDKVNYLVMIGDSYRKLEEYDKTVLYYNQAYVESLQMNDNMSNVQQMIQGVIMRKLAEVDLLKN